LTLVVEVIVKISQSFLDHTTISNIGDICMEHETHLGRKSKCSKARTRLYATCLPAHNVTMQYFQVHDRNMRGYIMISPYIRNRKE